MSKGLERLAWAVIMQAARDWLSSATMGEQGAARAKAEAFFFGNSEDLNFWCDFAGTSADSIRMKLKRTKEQGISWRLSAGISPRYWERKAWREKRKLTGQYLSS